MNVDLEKEGNRRRQKRTKKNYIVEKERLLVHSQNYFPNRPNLQRKNLPLATHCRFAVSYVTRTSGDLSVTSSAQIWMRVLE